MRQLRMKRAMQAEPMPPAPKPAKKPAKKAAAKKASGKGKA